MHRSHSGLLFLLVLLLQACAVLFGDFSDSFWMVKARIGETDERDCVLPVRRAFSLPVLGGRSVRFDSGDLAGCPNV